ncbi:MAG: mRNA surveillance protein pelota [Methanosarcinales archaeon]|nr:mRNA surveillance protein pelota [Methanosarcinales archaeon]
MKVRERRLKNQNGAIELVPESLDDLWHLKYVIEDGDMLGAFTKRRVEGATDKIRPDAAEKRSTHLTIEVAGMEFHRFSNRLRVRGIIRRGIDTGEYHTINIEIGSMIKIEKHWKPDQLERVRDAVAASARPRVVIVTIESGEACIGFVRQFGVDLVTQITQPSGKRVGDSTHEFFATVSSALGQAIEHARSRHDRQAQARAQAQEQAIIVAGPGFIKEDFMEYLRSSKPDIAAQASLEDTTTTGTPGFLEVLRRGAVDRIVQESRIGREAELMDSLMREIATDGACAYGPDEVMGAVELGAVETLLIVDETLRSLREAKAGSGTDARIDVEVDTKADRIIDADNLLQQVEHAQGRVVVFSSEFEPGQRLDALGGIAALLRFKIA